MKNAIIAATLSAAGILSIPAHAKSTVTVVNNWKNPVDVAVFDGKESVCRLEDASKTHMVKSGESMDFTCSGESKDRCRVTILVPDTNKRYCTNLYKNCDGRAATAEDGGKVTLSGTGSQPDCALEGK